MDVPRPRFQACLPYLLEDIATAHFVSFDLEFSGVSGSQIKKSRLGVVSSHGKPTLQERYTETKHAVERYQVLQLGLTCVMENKDTGNYVLKPYNFFLDPVPNEKLHVERIFSYQSGAVAFLLSHQFRMEAPFLEGVPYFSREEETLSRHRRDNKSVFTDSDVDPNDIESLRFVEWVIKEIEDWKARRGPNDTYLNITTPESHESQISDVGLNGFQRRLVYQTVRNKYPEFKAYGRQSFIQLTDYDQEREKYYEARQQKFYERDLSRQIGLRWPVEAMANGDLLGLDPTDFPVYIEGRQDIVIQQVKELKAYLRGKHTVLVGHNAFTDLMYFYKCFFGTLPEKVEDFQRIIHELFPVVIDTKYLATHNRENPALADSSLQQLDVEFSNLPLDETPTVILHEEHGKYFGNTPSHEAGFDSYQTAKLLIRLSAKLEAAGSYVDLPISPPIRNGDTSSLGAFPTSSAIVPSDEEYHTPPEGEGVIPTKNRHPPEQRYSDSSSGGVSLEPLSFQDNADPADMQQVKRKSTAKTRKPKSEMRANDFAHKGMFDSLLDLPPDMDELSGSMNAQEPKTKPVMMPPFDSHFWEVYGNKLRVNGTLEGVCNLLGE